MDDRELQAICARTKHKAAIFITELKETFRTSQNAVNHVTVGVDSLMDDFLDLLKVKSNQELSDYDGYLSLSQFHCLLESLKGQSLFEGIQSVGQLDTYLEKHTFDSLPLLKELVLSRQHVWRRGIPKLVKKEVGYHVDFRAQLEQLLNCRDVLHCIENPQVYVKGKFKTITDGLNYRFHPLVMKHGNKVLFIIIYVDDVEVCDALKSKTGKHNLRLFYWLLANIPPELRSSLKAINLLAIVKKKTAQKYGNDFILKEFVQDMTIFSTDGLNMKISGEVRRFIGTLGHADGDAPALGNLGGMKESHFAKRPCRVCLVTRAEICTHFSESKDLLRKKHEHEEQVRAVMNHKNKNVVQEVVLHGMEEEEQEEMGVPEMQLDHKDPSVSFGINRKSILSDIPHFDVTKCLPFDVMHVLCEGVVEMVCRLAIREACFRRDPQDPTKLDKNRLRLESLNDIIERYCDFGHLHRSKPSVIEKSHVFNKLRQSAAQMIVLANILPIVLNAHLPEEHKKLLLLVVKILNLSMSFEFTLEEVCLLERTIVEFGECFKRLYPNKKTLKLHFLVHLPSQIRLHGPLRQQACFRFEAMHTQVTSLVGVVRSKVNIALSCAKRVICRRNLEILKAKDAGTFLYSGDKIVRPAIVPLSGLPDSEKQCLLESIPNLNEMSEICELQCITKYGSTWKKGVVIHTGNHIFGAIDKVFQIRNELWFVFNQLRTDFIDPLNAFQILSCNEAAKCIKYDSLPDRFPITRWSLTFPRRNTLSYLLMIPTSGI